ncbi:hypothetical protein RRG08_000234 [Elysia crispata]|uniref:Uncharacterized protein n=1 Tax=Elysia crispata TaxID=231223 RepID=A0AAE1E5U5_9GAST|nr:hypothetical protein RRG08_000234 [Elysia crispata]
MPQATKYPSRSEGIVKILLRKIFAREIVMVAPDRGDSLPYRIVAIGGGKHARRPRGLTIPEATLGATINRRDIHVEGGFAPSTWISPRFARGDIYDFEGGEAPSTFLVGEGTSPPKGGSWKEDSLPSNY